MLQHKQKTPSLGLPGPASPHSPRTLGWRADGEEEKSGRWEGRGRTQLVRAVYCRSAPLLPFRPAGTRRKKKRPPGTRAEPLCGTQGRRSAVGAFGRGRGRARELPGRRTSPGRDLPRAFRRHGPETQGRSVTTPPSAPVVEAPLRGGPRSLQGRACWEAEGRGGEVDPQPRDALLRPPRHPRHPRPPPNFGATFTTQLAAKQLVVFRS